MLYQKGAIYMKKARKEMCLSGVFLETLGEDFTLKTVLKALGRCDERLLEGTVLGGKIGRAVKRFMVSARADLGEYAAVRQEIMDFWDVYGEFDDMLTPGMKKRYLILWMI